MSSPFSPGAALTRQKQCFECGAVLREADAHCWMCSAEQPVMGKLLPPTVVPPPANPWSRPLMIWLAVIVVLLIGYGVLYAGEPVLATLYAIVVVPTLLIVMLGSATARAVGRPWGTGTKVGVAVTTFASTVAIAAIALLVAVLIAIATVIALFQECFRLLGGGS